MSPFSTSSPLMLAGTPHATVNASLALSPIRPPACQNCVRKAETMAVTVAQVAPSLAAKTKDCSAALIDCSM